MSQINWERERERLEKLYAAMSEGELQEVADDADSLTDVARTALRAEMLRRGMEAPPEMRVNPGAGEVERQPPKPVIVGRYRDLSTASVAKSILDSAGIESFLADDNVIRMDWFYSNALGGIKLLVRDVDAPAAGELLEARVPEKFDVEGVGEYEQPKCPKCGSLDVSFEELDRKIAHTGLLISLPIPAGKHGWNCHSCGHNWDSSTETTAE
jgi:putative signal transducing protein